MNWNMYVPYWQFFTAIASIAFMFGVITTQIINLSSDIADVKEHLEKIEDKLTSFDVRITILEKK